MKNVVFSDAKISYSKCLPNEQDLHKFNLDSQNFCSNAKCTLP